jgi:hypothetical protein
LPVGKFTNKQGHCQEESGAATKATFDGKESGFIMSLPVTRWMNVESGISESHTV